MNREQKQHKILSKKRMIGYKCLFCKYKYKINTYSLYFFVLQIISIKKNYINNKIYYIDK